MYITEAYTIVASVRNREALPAHITPERFALAKRVVEAHADENPLYRQALKANAKMGR